jgi:ribonuclease BN (tRNA processing enzyme)
VIVVSHFHADHCFGWPFLLEALAENAASTGAVGGMRRAVHVVGPPDIEAHLVGLCDAGAVGSVFDEARRRLDLRFVEVDGTWQEVPGLRFRAVEVVHVPYLRCFGYLFEREGRTVAYSGDTTPCQGLDELAAASDVLVVECNGRHTPPGVPTSHMDEESIRALRSAHPDVHLIATHLGEQVDTGALSGVTVPADFEHLVV